MSATVSDAAVESGEVPVPHRRFDGDVQPALPAGRRVGTLWSTWRRPLLVGLGVTVVLRLVTEWIALDAAYGSQFPHVLAHNPRVWFDVWNHWDAGYYLAIAEHGYPVSTASTGHLPRPVAFGPLYPAAVWSVRAVTGIGVVVVGQVVSFVALVAAATGIAHLVERDEDSRRAGATVTLLVAFPTAFFLLADYPDSLALALCVWSFIAVRDRRWLLAGLAAAGATMTKYYLAVAVVALAYEVWTSRPGNRDGTRDRLRRAFPALAAVVGPTVVAVGAWMLVCGIRYGDPLAFVHAQADWQRHVAWPWQLATHTLGDLVHLRFLDTATASIMELLDTVTLVLLTAATVVAFRTTRRSYGILLALGLASFLFQNMLYNDTREVLVLFPFFIVGAGFVDGHPWRERAVLACLLPTGYFLIVRFVTGSFSG